jgi:hypothetical protein
MSKLNELIRVIVTDNYYPDDPRTWPAEEIERLIAEHGGETGKVQRYCYDCVHLTLPAYIEPCYICCTRRSRVNFTPRPPAPITTPPPVTPTPAPPATCGECAWHLTHGDWGNEVTPPNPLGGNLPQVVFGSKKCGTYDSEPACPAFVARQTEKKEDEG